MQNSGDLSRALNEVKHAMQEEAAELQRVTSELQQVEQELPQLRAELTDNQKKGEMIKQKIRTYESKLPKLKTEKKPTITRPRP